MTAQKKSVRPAKGVSAPAAGREPAIAGTDTRFWAVDWAWSLLLTSLVLVPLLITNRSWLPGATGAVWFQGGATVLKAVVAQVVIGAAFACFSIAVITGHAVVRWNRVAWLGVGFVAWSGLTVLTSVSPATALVGAALTGQGWLALATFGAAGFLTLQLADSPSRIRTLLKVAGLTAGVIALYGLVQTAGLDPLKWQSGEWGLFRSFGTIGNPDMFGAYMVLNLFVLAGLQMSERDKRWRVAYTLATLAVASATFTSLTRAAWLGAVAGAVVFAFVAARLHTRFTRTHLVVALVLLAVVAGATALSLSNPDVDSNVVSRVKAAFDPTDKNTLGRTETWGIAVSAIGKRPVFGYGPDTFGQAFQVNKTERFASLVEPNIIQANAHSALIQLGVESGVPAALLWLALLVAAGIVSLRTLAASEGKGAETRLVLGGVLASVAGYFVALLLTPANPDSSLVLWCMLAVLVSPAARRVTGPLAAKLAAVPLIVGSAAMLAALTFAFASTQAAVADDETIAASVRTASADTATRLDPLSAEFAAVAAKAYAQTLLQRASTGADAAALSTLYDSAQSQMRRAVAIEPIDTHRRATLVSLLLIGGANVDKRHYAEAVTVAALTAREAPNDLETAYWYARALDADGRKAEAVPVLERVLRLRPGYADAAILLSDLYVAKGDTASARATLQRAIDLASDPTALRKRLDNLP